jgi:hypothetical protein
MYATRISQEENADKLLTHPFLTSIITNLELQNKFNTATENSLNRHNFNHIRDSRN